jgi:hypothetical protein
LSLVEFKSFEYQQSKQVIATDDIKQEILKTGIRKLERETGLSHHTIDKILKGERVRRMTLAKIIKSMRPETRRRYGSEGKDQAMRQGEGLRGTLSAVVCLE